MRCILYTEPYNVCIDTANGRERKREYAPGALPCTRIGFANFPIRGNRLSGYFREPIRLVRETRARANSIPLFETAFFIIACSARTADCVLPDRTVGHYRRVGHFLLHHCTPSSLSRTPFVRYTCTAAYLETPGVPNVNFSLALLLSVLPQLC